ncbi:MAG: sigma 54-interacting transcriptional regulator, partial [Lentisphaerae bacterium]|nr:sigma 54-interacting transcriptional regulator [Lentisphaerota bacterium]
MSTAFLIQNDLPDAPRTIPLTKSECRVGRIAQADIVLNNPSISRQHAVIQRSQEGFIVLDSNSRNGTRVNGVAVARRLLRDGDHIRFGDVELLFHESDESDERPGQFAVKGKVPPPMDNELLSGTTCSFFTTGTRDTRHLELVNSWQVINLFDLCARTEIDTVLQVIVKNLAGIQGIRKICLVMTSAFADGRERWIKAGPSASRPGVCFSEEMLKEVARTGSAKSVTGGSWSSGVQDNSTPDAVCLPIIIQGHAEGCLYIEGSDRLSWETVQGAKAGAKAIGLGLTIWKSALRASSPATAPASASIAIVGKSQVLQQAMRLAEKAAHSDATLLIRGETGTGKELFARLVYEDSPRRSAPFIPVHCSAMEETLLGSALFGHEKGAYTGAVGMKKGLFEKADRGTIFLDEIGDLSLAMQVKLLRVLQEGEFMRLGGNAPIRVDVRVIAATNRDLEKAVREQTF